MYEIVTVCSGAQTRAQLTAARFDHLLIENGYEDRYKAQAAGTLVTALKNRDIHPSLQKGFIEQCLDESDFLESRRDEVRDILNYGDERALERVYWNVQEEFVARETKYKKDIFKEYGIPLNLQGTQITADFDQIAVFAMSRTNLSRLKAIPMMFHPYKLVDSLANYACPQSNLGTHHPVWEGKEAMEAFLRTIIEHADLAFVRMIEEGILV